MRKSVATTNGAHKNSRRHRDFAEGHLVVSLACMVMPVLNAMGPILVRRYELGSTAFASEGKLLLTTVCECLKLAIMITVVHVRSLGDELGTWGAVLRPFEGMPAVEVGRYALPALCYCIDNNLTLVALQYLRPHTLQVLASSKILVTAALFRCFLGRVVSCQQWVCLTVLVIGMCVAETQGRDLGSDYEAGPSDNLNVGVPIVSLFVVFGAFANIWIEYLFKHVDTEEPFPVRNARLYVFGVLINGFLLISDAVGQEGGWAHASWSLWWGLHSAELWLLAANSGIAGIFTAFIFAYADNIIGVLLQGIVLPLMLALQWVWYGLVPNSGLLLGALLVTIGIVGVKAAPKAPANGGAPSYHSGEPEPVASDELTCLVQD